MTVIFGQRVKTEQLVEQAQYCQPNNFLIHVCGHVASAVNTE